jgi:hypothetical protein
MENLNFAFGQFTNLHEILLNDIVTHCPNCKHTRFSADIPEISSIESLVTSGSSSGKMRSG